MCHFGIADGVLVDGLIGLWFMVYGGWLALSFEFLVVSFELFAKPLPQCCQQYIFMQGLLVVEYLFGRKSLRSRPGLSPLQ